MTARCVVEPLHVVEHIFAGSAHAADDAAIGHQTLELLAGVLAGLVGVMMQESIRLAALPESSTGRPQPVGQSFRL